MMTDGLEVVYFLLRVLTFYTKLPFGAIADDGVHMMFSFLLGKTLFFIFISSFFILLAYQTQNTPPHLLRLLPSRLIKIRVWKIKRKERQLKKRKKIFF
jgi:hypothetical protein